MTETMEQPITMTDSPVTEKYDREGEKAVGMANEAYAEIMDDGTKPQPPTPQRPPTQKEIAQYEKEQKMIRKNNREFLDDAEMRLRNAQINTEFIETNVRAMKAFMESEALRDDYLKLVEKKKVRDEQDSKINDSK